MPRQSDDTARTNDAGSAGNEPSAVLELWLEPVVDVEQPGRRLHVTDLASGSRVLAAELDASDFTRLLNGAPVALSSWLIPADGRNRLGRRRTPLTFGLLDPQPAGALVAAWHARACERLEQLGVVDSDPRQATTGTTVRFVLFPSAPMTPEAVRGLRAELAASAIGYGVRLAERSAGEPGGGMAP